MKNMTYFGFEETTVSSEDVMESTQDTIRVWLFWVTNLIRLKWKNGTLGVEDRTIFYLCV